MTQSAAAFATEMNPRLQPRSSEHHSHTSLVRLHSSSPVPRPDNDVEGPVPDTRSTPRNSGQSLNEIRKSLHARLSASIPLREIPSKEIARRIDASADTVESHRQGNIPQSWAQMIAYCRAYPAFGVEVMELMGIDIDQDPRAFAMFLSLQKQVRGE